MASSFIQGPLTAAQGPGPPPHHPGEKKPRRAGASRGCSAKTAWYPQNPCSDAATPVKCIRLLSALPRHTKRGAGEETGTAVHTGASVRCRPPQEPALARFRSPGPPPNLGSSVLVATSSPSSDQCDPQTQKPALGGGIRQVG